MAKQFLGGLDPLLVLPPAGHGNAQECPGCLDLQADISQDSVLVSVAQARGAAEDVSEKSPVKSPLVLRYVE